MMKLLFAIGITFSISTNAISAPKKHWCCVVQDQIASFEAKGKKKNICVKSAAEPKSKKSSYVKKCKKMAGTWVEQEKK